ncbi:TniQ family protein [Metabacillus litoralis]|uniref:TniQ family protein n=1 Tax=Metabacillus litoralis TaxID=152268 RepID=UPI00203FA3C0|nr:TniQ family protein [Metabacillus litoralis]MCM3410212.1 TniQ family protein [Metabacillus litoralis]
MLIYPKPYADETLLSFVYRVSIKNLMDKPTWIFYCFEKYLSIRVTENLVNWVGESDLEAIAAYLKLSLEEANALSIITDLRNLNLEVNNIPKNQWYLYSRTRYCPLCLIDNSYQRKAWINSHSIICLKHKCFLNDNCTNCQNSINSIDIIQNNCSKCNNKLTYSSFSKCDLPLLNSYQKLIDQIFLENRFIYEHPWIKNSSTFLRALNFITLWVSKLIEPDLLSIPNQNICFKGKVLERNHLKNFMTIEQSICLYRFSFSIINNWPESFYKFLELAENHNKYNFSSFLKHGITKLINTDLWPISKEVTAFIAKKFNLNGNQFIRSDEIKYMNLKFYGNIVYSNLIRIHKINYFGVHFNLVNKEDMVELIEKFEHSYTKEELRNLWGTSARVTSSILNSQHLNDVFSFQAGSANTWVIPISSIRAFEQKLKCLPSSYFKDPISLTNAFQWIGPDNASLILEGILTNNIKFKYNDLKFSSTLISKRDCYFFAREMIISQSLEYGSFSLRDLVFILGVKQTDIKYWYETGRFGNTENFDEYIPAKLILKFLNKYITTYELSFHLDVNIKKVLKRHSSGYYKSFSGPAHNDGKRLLFKRKDITTISNFI